MSVLKEQFPLETIRHLLYQVDYKTLVPFNLNLQNKLNNDLNPC